MLKFIELKKLDVSDHIERHVKPIHGRTQTAAHQGVWPIFNGLNLSVRKPGSNKTVANKEKFLTVALLMGNIL